MHTSAAAAAAAEPPSPSKPRPPPYNSRKCGVAGAGRLLAYGHMYMVHIHWVGQSRVCVLYMTVYLVISLPKILYVHCICVVLANPAYTYKALTVHFFLCCICRARFCPYLLRLLSQGAPLNVPFHNNFFHLPLTAHAWCTTRSDEVCTKVCVKARTHREAGTEARAQSISDQARAQSFSDQARAQSCSDQAYTILYTLSGPTC